MTGYSYQDSGNPGYQHQFVNSYDYHNRLIESKATAVTPGTVSYDSTFGYDFFGNMTCTSSPGIGCPGLSFDSNNHVTGTTGITYDGAGNMTQDGTGTGTHTYTYDGENRLTQVDGGSTQTFLYNALGQLVEWTAGSTTYDELFDVNGNRIAQAVGGVWNTGNFFLGSRMLGAYIPSTGTVQFFHANALGSSTVGWRRPLGSACFKHRRPKGAQTWEGLRQPAISHSRTRREATLRLQPERHSPLQDIFAE